MKRDGKKVVRQSDAVFEEALNKSEIGEKRQIRRAVKHTKEDRK